MRLPQTARPSNHHKHLDDVQTGHRNGCIRNNREPIFHFRSVGPSRQIKSKVAAAAAKWVLAKHRTHIVAQTLAGDPISPFTAAPLAVLRKFRFRFRFPVLNPPAKAFQVAPQCLSPQLIDNRTRGYVTAHCDPGVPINPYTGRGPAGAAQKHPGKTPAGWLTRDADQSRGRSATLQGSPQRGVAPYVTPHAREQVAIRWIPLLAFPRHSVTQI